ncbi:MAG: hypothetical protein ACKA33_01050 [Candidatus Karelsulcia muelleri]
MNPLNRTLRKVKIDNFKNANYIFSMLMGKNVFKRRKFIEQILMPKYFFFKKFIH